MEPWHFDQHLLVLKKIGSVEQSSTIKFDSTPLWVRLYDMPMVARTESTVRSICEKIGKVVEIDSLTMEGFSRSIRVRVLINLNKPLMRGVKIVIPNVNPLWISIKYERLPSFCYIYRYISHLKRDCEVIDAKDEYISLADDRLHFGDWLRASPSKQIKVIVEEPKADDNLATRKKLFHAFMQETREQENEPDTTIKWVMQELDDVLKNLEKYNFRSNQTPTVNDDGLQLAITYTQTTNPQHNQPETIIPTLQGDNATTLSPIS